jgi:HK97 family phage major capsid protein
MSKKLDLSELRKKKNELAAEIRKQADAYDARRKEEKDAWPDETRAAWESTNKLYDENEQAIREIEKDDEVRSRVDQLKKDEEQSRRTNNRPGLDDKLPGEERTYGDAGLDRDEASLLAQRQRDKQLAFRMWMLRDVAGEVPQLITDEMREAAQRMTVPSGKAIIVSLPDTRSYKTLQRQFAALNPAQRQLALESGELRALSKFTATAGPELVPQTFINVLMLAILSHGDMLSAIETITTQTGEQMLWPVGDDTSNEGAWVQVEAEDTQVIGQPDPVFNRQTWDAHELHSKWVKVPIALNEDSMVDLEVAVATMLGERIGRSLNKSATIGNGTKQCRGITIDAPLGVTTALATAISFDDLTKLEHSVDPAYRAQSSYMFNDAILLAIRLLKDTTGRPLWAPSVREGAPDMINNKPYVYNNHMASTITTTTLTALFGRLIDYKLRLVRGVRIVRAEERFIENLLIGFLGYTRADGRLQRPTADARVSVKKMVQA